MWTTVFKLVLQVLAGVGLGEVADKVLPEKVPTYPTTGKVFPGLSVIPRLLWFIGIFVLAGIILKYIGRKMKITILK